MCMSTTWAGRSRSPSSRSEVALSLTGSRGLIQTDAPFGDEGSHHQTTTGDIMRKISTLALALFLASFATACAEQKGEKKDDKKEEKKDEKKDDAKKE